MIIDYSADELARVEPHRLHDILAVPEVDAADPARIASIQLLEACDWQGVGSRLDHGDAWGNLNTIFQAAVGQNRVEIVRQQPRREAHIGRQVVDVLRCHAWLGQMVLQDETVTADSFVDLLQSGELINHPLPFGISKIEGFLCGLWIRSQTTLTIESLVKAA